MRRRDGLLRLSALAVLALGINVAVHRSAADAEARLDRAERANAGAWEHLAAVQSMNARVEATTAHTTTVAGRTELGAGAAATSVEKVAAVVASIRASLAAVVAESGAATGTLDSLRSAIASSAAQADDLRTCLGGVAAANDAARTGNTLTVIALMQAAAPACERAEAVAGAVDPTIRFPYDFPDPYVLPVADGYLAYATNSAGGAVQLLRSTDLVEWSFAGTALSGVASWARPGATWAPSVVARGSGWVLYYTVRDQASGRQCISAATATAPTGPFSDRSTAPLVCELGEGGSIDPSPYVAADGSAYLLWKSEGETTGGAAAVRSQRLTADGLGLTGAPAVLATVDQAWEGRTIEGPSMVHTGGSHLLLYSANRWDSGSYAIGAAWCDTPTGPCRKVAGPILRTFGAMVGPGGAEAFVDRAGTLRVAFHAWQGNEVGYPNDRYLHIGRLDAGGGAVTIALE